MTDRELAGCALSEVLALLEKATPGEWSHAAEYGWNIATDNYDPMSRVGASVGMALWPKDAYAICASVNFLRQHGPALLAALSTPSSEGYGRDGERWRYVRAHMDCLHIPGLDISGPSEERIDAAIDAAIAAAEGDGAPDLP